MNLKCHNPYLNLALPLLREELRVDRVQDVGHLDAVGDRRGRGQLHAEAGRQPPQDGVRRRGRHDGWIMVNGPLALLLGLLLC